MEPIALVDDMNKKNRHMTEQDEIELEEREMKKKQALDKFLLKWCEDVENMTDNKVQFDVP